MKEVPLETRVEPTQVAFRMLASPINPADINQIEGVYPVMPPLPAVAGNEGVAEVTQVGSKVTSVRVGDWFIPAQAGFGTLLSFFLFQLASFPQGNPSHCHPLLGGELFKGTWRTEGVWEETMVQRIQRDVPLEFAATLSVNPCTAYRMLQDFVTLREGDAVIQNGANGGVGRAVIQLAARRKFRTINIVRKRDNFKELESDLLGLGATLVITDEDLVKVPATLENIRRVLGASIGGKGERDLPALALNCVGGDNATNMLRYLRPGGVMVTYGGMSRRPVVIPTGSLIFKDHSFRGFWMTRWSQENSREKREEMLVDLCNLAKAGLFQVDAVRVPLSDFRAAMSESLKSYKSGKQLLVM